ncbi:type II toxin-antitoxin system HicB family antitoxin [Pseudosporangium ferrugineum]|uniref:Uncharacterized protein n=1 Tax=Pseudosporangium ferrugineum TaxID=439699 RepID=A0A2T0RS35_9ACTN|nr:type II toxin-antitoxin system HicB family antitoxin [Pseudosporangium ferrugineum]PRY24015.1 hypothetical protein CLV70_114148 [Pseudosporangium ferrugineum]
MIEGRAAMSEVRRFQLEVHKDENGYWAEVLDLPGCFASGRDLTELFEALSEAIGLYLTDESVTVTVDRVEEEIGEKVRKLPIRATLVPAG